MTLSPSLLVPQPTDDRMVVDWHTLSRVEVLQQSVTGEVCLRLMGQGSKQLLIIVTTNYTASAYSETGALPVSPLYGMQGIAELDPLKYTSSVKIHFAYLTYFILDINKN